ncbi:MAG: hypothetical protein BIFFINMI_03742 [Phycisphaerae bacterium]|nr:hypothetical protein [Phycisphaerae bacterium]
MNRSLFVTMGMATLAVLLSIGATPSVAALVGLDSNVSADQTFADGLFVYDTFSAPGSAVGFASSTYGGVDWSLASDRYVAGNGGTVVRVQGVNKNRYLPSEINYDSAPGANNTYWSIVVMANPTYGGGSNNAQFSSEGAFSDGTANWTNGYKGQVPVPGVSQDANYHMFVSKMTWTAHDTRDITVWFDPDLSLAENNAVNTAKVNVDNVSNSGSNVRLYILGLGATDVDATFDYFGVSTGSPFTVAAAVPEPGTLALLGLGGLSLLGASRRRRSRAGL